MSEAAALSVDRFARQPWLGFEAPARRSGTADLIWMRLTAPLVAATAGLRGGANRAIVAAVLQRQRALEGLDGAALQRAARAAGRRALADEPARLARAADLFACVREAATRRLGQSHRPVQLMGGWALMKGQLAEMATGEGKTLTITLAAAAMALTGRPTHVVTVNDYLAARDHAEMGPVYAALGLSVGLVTRETSPDQRRAAYAADVTYCTGSELAFDFLKDRAAAPARPAGRLTARTRARYGACEAPLLRGLAFAIVDEADSVLIDEARTPLILSAEGPANFDPALLAAAWRMAQALPRTGYAVDQAARRTELTASGRRALAAGDGKGLLANARIREELVVKALTARELFNEGEHYLIADGKLVIVDEYTGRRMPDRFWSDGLHQMIELKAGLPQSGGRVTLARTTYQRFFRRYDRLAGLTGTAEEVSGELWRTYRLKVARIPTHRPVLRKSAPARVFRREADKWAAIARRAEALGGRGLPVLIGARSVAASQAASAALSARGLEHRVLSAAQDAEEAAVIGEAGLAGRITVATNMAGRGADIRLAPGVAEKGGLHVIMSESHDSARIDRQLAGRAGRQGEPGRFEAYLSLEDALVRQHGGPALRRIAAAPIGFLRRRAITTAQRRAEALHARMRADLMKQDGVLTDAMSFSGAPD